VVRVGNELTYTVSVVNGGPGTAADVTITDDLPAGMGLISATSSQGAGCSGMDPVVCDVGDVGSGAMVTVTMVVTPTATGVTYNTAEVAGSDLFENPVSDSGGVLVEVVDPAIEITKEGPATAAVGERVVYTLTVVNDDIAGDGSVIRNPVVNDALAGGATLVSAGDGDDELEVGESWVYTASYTVGPTDPDPLVNTAEVSGEGQDGSGVSATDSHSTDLTFAPALEIEKEGPATAAVGERVEYTFRVRNDDEIGDGSPVSEVAVSDDVAGEAAYASGDDGDSLLEVGETWVYTAAYTIQEGDPDPLVNVGTATGEDREGDEMSATASHSTEVGQPTPEKYQVFLPLVSNGYAAGGAAPDLVVGRISVTGSGVEIVIKNEGEVAVEKGFWVDLYVNPHPVPTGVNQTWQTLSSEGMVWGVEGAVLPLEPGEELALTMGDAHYRSDYSNFSGAFLAGVPVYVQVDSANAGTTYGAVLEGHEMVGGPYNNIAGPAYAVSSLSEESAGEERPVVSDTVPSSSDHPLRTQRTIVRPDQCPPRP
jgi:uncharacterized repeat protein (TIGR01451 family)